jgi:hypothetical protein
MTRKHIPLPEKLAALLGPQLGVTYERLKSMTAKEINSRFDWDHYPIRKADGGDDVHWNIFPRLRADHIEKTKRDAKDMAKERKVRRAVGNHAANMVMKASKLPPTVEWTSWPDPLTLWADAKRKSAKRKIRSRSFPKQRRGFGR